MLPSDPDMPDRRFFGDLVSHVAELGGLAWLANGLGFFGAWAAPAGSPRSYCGVVGRDPDVVCELDDMDDDAPRRSKYSDGSDGDFACEMSRKGSA